MKAFTKIVNPITMGIIEKAESGDTIRSLAKKTGFAYSAVYRWSNALAAYGVLGMEKKGNKTLVSINQNPVQRRFKELFDAIQTAERDRIFWILMKKTMLGVRFAKGTAAVIWTQGGYITGDFFEKIYHIEVLRRDYGKFASELKRHSISFTNGEARPLIRIKIRERFATERKGGFPVMPLKELVLWCMKLHLEPILEQLDILYNLGLKTRYSEVFTNV